MMAVIVDQKTDGEQEFEETQMANSMSVLRFEVNPNKDVQDIVGSLLLFASAVFQAKFPGEKGAEHWEAAMNSLARSLDQHAMDQNPYG